ncbi:conserved exported hypothetical protein [Bradyrhizobium sp. ORS 375]|uniref:hypothetical protein n=1 Tax=Bradyrhizobium sp. (strain ORS 375) TaxID=566679 RepID=UPI000240ACF9|nr:hypothetical protein [Bradyrhizobium sp. ORS 375]CCD91757.1 conserved exported hypothetical protein [Bradyrhizobium sp. ORS 375]
MSYILGLAFAAVLLFFLFLPITDRRTVLMKLGMMVAAVILFAAAFAVPRAAGPFPASAQALVLSHN